MEAWAVGAWGELINCVDVVVDVKHGLEACCWHHALIAETLNAWLVLAALRGCIHVLLTLIY